MPVRTKWALARLLSGLERHPVHREFGGLILGQGTYVGRRFDSALRMGGHQLMLLSHIDASLSPSLSLPSSLSLKSIIIIIISSSVRLKELHDTLQILNPE